MLSIVALYILSATNQIQFPDPFPTQPLRKIEATYQVVRGRWEPTSPTSSFRRDVVILEGSFSPDLYPQNYFGPWKRQEITFPLALRIDQNHPEEVMQVNVSVFARIESEDWSPSSNTVKSYSASLEVVKDDVQNGLVQYGSNELKVSVNEALADQVQINPTIERLVGLNGPQGLMGDRLVFRVRFKDPGATAAPVCSAENAN